MDDRKDARKIADVYRLETPEQALALLNPLRADILRLLEEPGSASEVGRKLGEPPQKVNYHLKGLEKVGLVRRSGTRQVRNLVEVLYQAVARTFVIPDAFGWPEELTRRMKDQGALRQLINAAERIRRDAVLLMEASDSKRQVPSAVLETEVALPDEKTREAFLRDYAQAVREVTERYRASIPGAGGEGFRAVLAVYPDIRQGGDRRE
ncbi:MULTISPECIES: ArsR/SmtB family transcription factor [Cohnella]|jgi:DNA-binding transcriptional ArsR family regulator|uniref:ArsR/SmtB family transcription factor n=1 Tax=Cohnella TaxID=329857 RepID=UPI000E38731C|nr:helix-turn-helix domain-containing protein [Cohnella sp.]REK64000.1 MAG: ArsR family transcriptional regulator [Cohnella sp.]